MLCQARVLSSIIFQAFLYCAMLYTSSSTPVILTRQTQSHQQMLKLATDDTRCHLLGAMEATQSSVVDVQNVDVASISNYTGSKRANFVSFRLIVIQ